MRELSIIAARGADGDIAAYPLGENHHEDGILRRSIAPADASFETGFMAEADRPRASLKRWTMWG